MPDTPTTPARRPPAHLRPMRRARVDELVAAGVPAELLTCRAQRHEVHRV
jgi:hypothetical protein